MGAPAFDEFAGSELLGLLVRQWNAMKALATVDAGFYAQARALGAETAAAEVQLKAAFCTRVAADADVAAQIATLDQQDQEIQAEIGALNAEEAQYWAEIVAAEDEESWACGDAAMAYANQAGDSYSGATNRNLARNADDFH
jgi:peptidoglycan hydrolase CwlO-like protein